MKDFEFDHLEDLTFRVIGQVHDELINYLKSMPSIEHQNQWESVLNHARFVSQFEFVFRYEIELAEIVRHFLTRADSNGRKIKKASVLYDKEFEGIDVTHESSFYDSYNEMDLRKAIKYSLWQFHQLILERK